MHGFRRRVVGAIALTVLPAFSPVALPAGTFASANAPHRVQSGQTLTHIAHQYAVSVATLEKINRIQDGHALKPGQTLWIPKDPPKSKHKRVRVAAKPVSADFYRISQNRRAKITLLNAQGRVSKQGRTLLGSLMRPRLPANAADGPKETKRKSRAAVPAPHARLVQLLAQISQHFDGKTIHVISGVRHPGGHTHKTSRHVSGRAIDFRIPGVANTVLRDYCRKLPHVGVGYYPRSTFVHLDVRDKNAFWVDMSKTGEAPRYVRNGSFDEKDILRKKLLGQDTGQVSGQDTGVESDEESEDSAAIENDETQPSAEVERAVEPARVAKNR